MLVVIRLPNIEVFVAHALIGYEGSLCKKCLGGIVICIAS